VACAGIGLAVAPHGAWAQDDPASSRPRAGDLLVRAGDTTIAPLGPNDIPSSAAQTMAWAMDAEGGIVRSGSRLNRVMLVRLDAESLTADTRARAADGVVAYTAICTHTGCEVLDWVEAERLLRCPCHLSTFDPRDSARVVEGPAPRALPALPLAVARGRLVVAASFTARVGFEQG
jgi:Rieske Fe-S protein